MNIYELLHEMIPTERYRLSICSFDEDKKEFLESDSDKKAFNLLKNISSLHVRQTNNEFVFLPAFILNDGSRTFSIEDLCEEDFEQLNALDLQQIPLNLQARIYDILWICKKDYRAAKKAAGAYFESFNLWFSCENWIGIVSALKRAICISKQINDVHMYEKCCKAIYDHVVKIDAEDNPSLLLHLIGILSEYPFGETDVIIDVLNKIIERSKSNPYDVKRSFVLKSKFLKNINDIDGSKKTNVELADYFVEYAECMCESSMQKALEAAHFYQDAIKLYKNNGEVQKSKTAHKRLIEIQKNIPRVMSHITTPFDATAIIKHINTSMENLSFEEAIIKLTHFVEFQKRENVKKQILSNMKETPFNYIFATSYLNNEGQTTSLLQPLDINNPEADEELLNSHIFKEMFTFQEISGSTYLKYAISYINKKFDIKKEKLAFLLKDNVIIPEGRENIISSALLLALTEQYYEALHILAPQVEHFFRNVAEVAGGITVTIDDEGVSNAKVLSSIFNLPEILDCYDNDILFFFRGMLHEHAGANIRNRIAHGIMDEASGSNGASIYFICAVIKLIVYSSPQCYKIFKSSDKLKLQNTNEEDQK